MGISKNRIFTMSQIEKLVNKTQELMGCADAVVSEIDTELVKLSDTIEKLPVDIQDSSLKQDVESLRNSIKTQEFSQYRSRMARQLNNLKNNIQQGDTKLQKEVASITVDMIGLTAQIKGMTDLIPKGQDCGTYEDFKKEYDVCVQAWTVLKEKLNEFKDQLVKAILGEKNIGVYNSKDPVNLSTGNFIYKKEDIHTKGMPVLSLSRTYNALDESMGSLGKGWRHSYEVYLVIGTEEVKVFLPDGKQEVFSRKKDNTFYSEISRNHLEKEEHGYRYQTFDKNTYYFNEEGGVCTV